MMYQAQWHQADIVIAGANPLMAAILTAIALRQGQSVMWWNNGQKDDWPDFLCQDATFREMVCHVTGWQGPTPHQWAARDEFLGLFISDPDAEQKASAALWCHALTEWAIAPLHVHNDRSFGMLAGTGRLSFGGRISGGAGSDEIMLFANPADQMKPPVLSGRPDPVDTCHIVLQMHAQNMRWHGRGKGSRLVFARKVFLLSRHARPVLDKTENDQGKQNMMFVVGSAHATWNDASPEKRIRIVLEDLLGITGYLTRD